MGDAQILNETVADHPPQYSRERQGLNICCEL